MAEFQNPPKDIFGQTFPVIQCNAEIKRRDGVYGFKGCTRKATQVFRYKSGGFMITMHYCNRHAHIGQAKEDAYNEAEYQRKVGRDEIEVARMAEAKEEALGLKMDWEQLRY